MGRIRRTELPDGYFHVMSRGVYGTDIFRDGTDRRLFLQRLGACERRHGWTCHAFCLMTTHYHVVVESDRVELSRGMQSLNGRYALWFNARHARYGHLFAGRFAARAIDGEEYLLDACTYVVLNPVRAGLCLRAADWPWSHSRFGLALD